MISHVHVGVGDFQRAFELYSAVLSELGWRHRFTDLSRPWAAWQPAESERPLFVIGRPHNGQPARPGNGQMVALTASRRAQVIAFHRRATALGCRDEGAPGLRPEYHADFYGAYVRDLDGNKICVCCHHRE